MSIDADEDGDKEDEDEEVSDSFSILMRSVMGADVEAIELESFSKRGAMAGSLRVLANGYVEEVDEDSGGDMDEESSERVGNDPME
jgi:hypothetical protein